MSKKILLILYIALVIFMATFYVIIRSPTCISCNEEYFCESMSGVCENECYNETIHTPTGKCEDESLVCCIQINKAKK